MRVVMPPWLLARGLVLVAVVAAYFIFAGFIDRCDLRPCIDPDKQGVVSTVAGPDQGLTSWDAWWYIRIARGGYDELLPESVRYWPLYPMLISTGASALFGSETAASLIISNLAAIAAGVLLFYLCRREKADEATATRAVWVMTLAPPAFVMVMAYTEPIAIAAAIAGFLAIRSDRWGWATAAGVVAGAVRPTGLFLLVPYLVEAFRTVGSTNLRGKVLRVVGVASPVAATAGYLAWTGARFGDPWLPFTVQNQANGRGEFRLPFLTILDAAWRTVSEARIDLGLHLLWLGLSVFLVVRTFRYWPASYGAFAAATVLQAISTTNLNSFERYALAAFPLSMTVALLLKDQGRERILLVLSAVALCAYATAAFISGYVP